jgi:membrane-bound lytic murein transglycosylase D
MTKKHLFLLLALGLSAMALLSCSSGKKRPLTTPISPPPASQAGTEQKAPENKPRQISPAREPAQLPKLPDIVEEKAKTGEEETEKTSLSEKEVSALLEAALSSYQDAQLSWEKGEFDACLSCLDETYKTILKIKVPPDSPLNQEKNDLRLLVAQRIQEIAATRLVTVGDNHRTIPLVENNWVKQEIQSFQTGERKLFEETFRISGLYREMILEELKKAGLPEELSWLPVIESWFRVRALSRARALGLWQFISSTGYRFGLKRDRWIDERMDPLKSTQAAVKYLSELHNLFGDWTTALAAYNCGEFRVEYVIRTQHVDYLDNFWDLYTRLPVETARFVPRFLAAVLIINNPEKYGFSLPSPEPPLRFETLTINHPFKLSALSTALGLEPSMLAFYNPEIRQDAVPEYEYQLKVPVGYGEKAAAMGASMPRWIPPETLYGFHYVRSGETLGIIAARYRTSVAGLMRLNGMKTTFIRAGQRLKIPGKGGSEGSPSPPASAGGKTPSQASGLVVYKVSEGETLFGIAQKFGMELGVLMALNNLSPESRIQPGQELRIQPKE